MEVVAIYVESLSLHVGIRLQHFLVLKLDFGHYNLYFEQKVEKLQQYV